MSIFNHAIDLKTDRQLRAIVNYGPQHLQYEAAKRELARRANN